MSYVAGNRISQHTFPHQKWFQNRFRVQRDPGCSRKRTEGGAGGGFGVRGHADASQDPNGPAGLCNGHGRGRRLPFVKWERKTPLKAERLTNSPGHNPKNSSSSVSARGKCSFVENFFQTETHTLSRKCAQTPPTQGKGQRNCGGTVCVEERQQPDSVLHERLNESHLPSSSDAHQHQSDRNHSSKPSPGLNRTPNSQRDSVSLMGQDTADSDGPVSSQEGIFSTEVPPRHLICTDQKRGMSQRLSDTADALREAAAQGLDRRRGTELFGSRTNQRAVRDQIRRVVMNLEEVLHGLKEVHTEMKEVVQQIELLTANIDLGEGDLCTSLPTDTLGSSCSSGVVTSTHKHSEEEEEGEEEEAEKLSERLDAGTTGRHDEVSDSDCSTLTASKASEKRQNPSRDSPKCKAVPSAPPPAYPNTPATAQNGRKALKSNHATLACQNQLRLGALGPKSRKPPPYPYGKAERANKGGGSSLKAPPYPLKRRLLSTTV